VSPGRRPSFTIAAVAAITGGAIGQQAGVSGLGLDPGLATVVGLLGLGALVALLVSAPARSTPPLATSDDTSWTEFRRELRRARRTGRPLTLLRIASEELPSGGAGGPSDLLGRSRKLGLHLRLVDRTWVDDASIYVLLPESPRAAADALIGRIRAASPAELPARVHIATFPENGLTSGALLAAVHNRFVDAIPIPIRPTTAEGVEVSAFEPDEELLVGEAARR
jgi:hypothetical protein